MKLVWNVFYHDHNNKEITTYNIFNHSGFQKDIDKILKKQPTREQLEQEVHNSLAYHFWCRYEYETIITTFPPKISKEEPKRVKNEFVNNVKERGLELPHVNIELETGNKVDIYTQVNLNFNAFVDYIESHYSNRECKYCSEEYDQKLCCYVDRQHSSSDSTVKYVKVNYCPHCGRKYV